MKTQYYGSATTTKHVHTQPNLFMVALSYLQLLGRLNNSPIKIKKFVFLVQTMTLNSIDTSKGCAPMVWIDIDLMLPTVVLEGFVVVVLQREWPCQKEVVWERALCVREKVCVTATVVGGGNGRMQDFYFGKVSVYIRYKICNINKKYNINLNLANLESD